MQQAVALLPWGHILLLMSSNLTPEHIIFYSNEVCSKGWSRDMLHHAIKAEYHLSAIEIDKSNNLSQTLSPQNAEYAIETTSSPESLLLIYSSLFFTILLCIIFLNIMLKYSLLLLHHDW